MRCWEHAPKRDTYRLEGGHTHHTLLACANRAWRTTSEFRSSWIPLSTITPPLLRPRHILCPVASPPRIPFPLSPSRYPSFNAKAFLSRKIKKKKNCISIEFALDYRSLRANKGHPASVFIVTLYIRVNLTSVPRSISVEAILFSPTKRSEVCSVFRSRNFEIRKIQRVRWRNIRVF